MFTRIKSLCSVQISFTKCRSAKTRCSEISLVEVSLAQISSAQISLAEQEFMEAKVAVLEAGIRGKLTPFQGVVLEREFLSVVFDE